MNARSSIPLTPEALDEAGREIDSWMATDGSAQPVHLVAVPAGTVFAFTPAPGERLICRRGTVWVTQEGDRRDHVLEVDEVIAFDRPAKVVVQPITRSATVQLPG